MISLPLMYHGVGGYLLGFAVSRFVQAPGQAGVGVFSSFVPRLESRDLSILKIILTKPIEVTATK